MEPEFQQQQPNPRGISIARLISSEFGTAEMVIRQQLGLGETSIEINGVPWTGDKLFIPRDKLVGKEIAVLGPERQWKMKYPETE